LPQDFGRFQGVLIGAIKAKDQFHRYAPKHQWRSGFLDTGERCRQQGPLPVAINDQAETSGVFNSSHRLDKSNYLKSKKVRRLQYSLIEFIFSMKRIFAVAVIAFSITTTACSPKT